MKTWRSSPLPNPKLSAWPFVARITRAALISPLGVFTVQPLEEVSMERAGVRSKSLMGFRIKSAMALTIAAGCTITAPGVKSPDLKDRVPVTSSISAALRNWLGSPIDLSLDE